MEKGTVMEISFAGKKGASAVITDGIFGVEAACRRINMNQIMHGL